MMSDAKNAGRDTEDEDIEQVLRFINKVTHF